MSPVYSAVGATNSYRLSAGGVTNEQTTGTQPKYCRLSRVGGASRAWYSTDGVSWTELGTQISFSGGLSNPVRLGIHLAGLSSSNHWVEVDWFKVRKYVNPEPTVNVGTEEITTYDYVLKVANQVANNWKVNLRVYDNFNIGRLSSAKVSLHDGTTSDQIIVNGGVITQSEGAQYDLAGSATIYISISNLQATTTGTSRLYVYLKIQVPNISTYNLLVITFEIT